jgi:hypothetical protein
MVGAPGYDPGRLQQSAAPVYKTELHTSADAVLLMRAIFNPHPDPPPRAGEGREGEKWSERLDLNQRPSRPERDALPG